MDTITLESLIDPPVICTPIYNYRYDMYSQTYTEEFPVVKKFYMCWAPDRGAPTKRHETMEEAEKEAARLIDQSGLAQVVILEAISVLEPESPPVVKRELTA